MAAQNYRDLMAWQKAMDLVESIYRATDVWPKQEMYGLVNQVRRAVVSIAANLAEGEGRFSRREFLHHAAIAHGSLREVETHLLIAQRLGYIDALSTRTMMGQAAEVGRLLQGLMRYLRTSIGS